MKTYINSIEDVEDEEDLNLKIVRKKSKKTQEVFEDQTFIEYTLMDFKNFEELNKFKNMKSLSLINQNITSIEVRLK